MNILSCIFPIKNMQSGLYHFFGDFFALQTLFRASLKGTGFLSCGAGFGFLTGFFFIR